MRTRYVTTIRLDDDALAKDLEHVASLPYSEAYSDYLIGAPWKNYMLWAVGGHAGDGVITGYPYGEKAAFTPYGEELPYLRSLITSTADLSRLNFVRLAPVADTVFIPHRDLLELKDLPDNARNAHRVHLVLATNENCFFSEDNTVYRMKRGDIWFLDAAQLHSVAVLSKEPRVHLIFDFIDTGDDAPLIQLPPTGQDMPADRVVARPPLPDAERAALRQLAEVLTADTFLDVFAIVIKKFFRYDAGENFVWDTMLAVARESPDPQVLPRALDLHRYYTLERS
ncbi:aspartyl/asparaginyl beta-hydroxylase domain-containing protein [Actinoplanes sp. NPDC049316]|uniref:aspartyl/asparaginyl beta-hydroxylase domain-containing protein n=1 Tax=Actinoplanes sp. NPDC049316 TaxID=3154727 RepID=UPI003421CD23